MTEIIQSEGRQKTSPTIVVLGGFLGAGKTATLIEAAQRLQERGQRVALITNDQAGDLVDTQRARHAASAVAEITGGCFCCRFETFQQTLQDVVRSAAPDIVLAEAVGSCTDLAATVYQPLQRFGLSVDVPSVQLGPLTVIVDGVRLHQLMRLNHLPHLPETVTYLYDRQLAEADILLLNKIDLLTAQQQQEASDYLSTVYPGTPVLPISATNGTGLDAWLDTLTDRTNVGQRVLTLDYDLYAEAEACLGWLNLAGTLAAGDQDMAEWVRVFLDRTAAQVQAAGAEIAHVKVWLSSATGTIAGHLLSVEGRPIIVEQGKPAEGRRVPLPVASMQASKEISTEEGAVLINARIAASPQSVRAWIDGALTIASNTTGCPFTIRQVTAISPARPVPTHRLLPTIGK